MPDQRTASLPANASARAVTLPQPLTSFIGREREVAAARDLLLRPDVRLLTLTGPGGAERRASASK